MSTSLSSDVAVLAPTLPVKVAACDFPPPRRDNVRNSSEVKRPLAVVVIGGLISATLLVLVGLPALFLAASSEDVTTPTASVS